MEILLEELYKTDLQVDKFHDRKLFLDDGSYQINGITKSGKSSILKNYLLSLKKSSYLYLDCSDIRIDISELNAHLAGFCSKNKIDVLALDNYYPDINFVNVSQLIVTSQMHYEIDFLDTVLGLGI